MVDKARALERHILHGGAEVAPPCFQFYMRQDQRTNQVLHPFPPTLKRAHPFLQSRATTEA
jgi:hypothetical protein